MHHFAQSLKALILNRSVEVHDIHDKVTIAEEDKISTLPDSLVSLILLYLTIKEAVRTCVLSSRWKHSWFLLPTLDLDSTDFLENNSFMSFTERFIYIAKEQNTCLQKLSVSNSKIKKKISCCVSSWVDFVATSKLEHLDVKISDVKLEHIESVPCNLYICEKLVHLGLSRVCLPGLENGCRLQLLKTMQLQANVYANESVLKTLITSCHILDGLCIARCADDNDDGIFDEDSSAIIDAPSLEYLQIADDMSVSKSLRLAKSLNKVEFLGAFFVLGEETTRSFFTGISRVRDMNISWMTFEFLKEKEYRSLPRFCNLSCLELELYYCAINYLPTFLASFPILTSLNLVLLSTFSHDRVRLSVVPQCFMNSLEIVTIKNNHFDDVELKVARFFAQKSLVLEELTLVGTPTLAVTRAFFKNQMISSTCQLSIVSS